MGKRAKETKSVLLDSERGREDRWRRRGKESKGKRQIYSNAASDRKKKEKLNKRVTKKRKGKALAKIDSRLRRYNSKNCAAADPFAILFVCSSECGADQKSRLGLGTANGL